MRRGGRFYPELSKKRIEEGIVRPCRALSVILSTTSLETIIEERRLLMTRTQILGLLIGASLLFDYEPIAQAAPMAASPNVVEMSASDGLVVKAFYARRVARRTTRRTVRRHGY